MPYIGNQAVVGDSANTFKLLDDIASFTVTFDATDSGVVSIANNTLTFNNHRFVTGQKVTYNDGGGTAIGGLSDGSYFIIKVDQSTIKLASSASNAAAGTAIDLTSGAAGGSHTLKIAFDGVNTKFKATHSNGTKAKISRAAQLSLSINGVIQQPQETSSPTIGYGIEADSTIVFSTAPAATDKVFGSFIGEVAASFDLTDNTVDEFTADGSTTTFTLSKTVPSSNDVLVTLDGVTQYPTTQSNARAYSVLENVLTFVSAPSAGVIIQVRHIGFAGASTSAVTGFYGRTGNVQLKNTDNVDVNNLTAAGTVTVTGDLNVTGDLTYDETVSRNLNVTGVATVASGIVSTGDFKIGTATTLSQDNIFTTGIITATSFVGSGANLTGVASTENIRTNTNATFLQNINVSGSTTTGSLVSSGAMSGTTGTFSGAVSGTTGTFTGDVDIADKIVHTGDTDTAIRFSAADTISIETGGVTRATVSGNNIDFPDAGTLRFGASNDLQIYHGTGGASNIIHSNTSQPLIINASGAGTIRFDTDSTERARIASNGDLLYASSDRNYASWYKSPTNSSSNAATSSTEVLTFGTAVIANTDVYDTSNGRYTAPVDGLYHIRFNGLIDNNASDGGKEIKLYKNGSVYGAQIAYQTISSKNSGDYNQMSGTGIMYMSTGDYAQIYASAGMHVSNETNWMVYLIRGTI